MWWQYEFTKPQKITEVNKTRQYALKVGLPVPRIVSIHNRDTKSKHISCHFVSVVGKQMSVFLLFFCFLFLLPKSIMVDFFRIVWPTTRSSTHNQRKSC